MSNFTPLVTKKFSFDDQEVRVRFKRLKRKHVLKHISLLSRFAKEFGEEALAPEAEGEEKKEDPRALEKLEFLSPMMEDIGDRLSEHVKELDGLTDSEGERITLETVLDDAYFLELVMEITSSLIEESLGPLGKKRSS